jgi:hypothetical protein
MDFSDPGANSFGHLFHNDTEASRRRRNTSFDYYCTIVFILG